MSHSTGSDRVRAEQGGFSWRLLVTFPISGTKTGIHLLLPGEAMAQEVGERLRQARQHRQLIGVE
jgi:hypothetical protein